MFSLVKQWFECYRLEHHSLTGFEECQIGGNSLPDTVILVRNLGMLEVQVLAIMILLNGHVANLLSKS